MLTSFTLSEVQLKSAPPIVRAWFEKEIDASLRDLSLLRDELPREEASAPVVEMFKEIVQVFVLIGDRLATTLDEVVAWWREQRIRERAYEIWERAGRPDDRALDHWLQAEAEVRRNSPQIALRDAEQIAGRFRYVSHLIQSVTLPLGGRPNTKIQCSGFHQVRF